MTGSFILLVVFLCLAIFSSKWWWIVVGLFIFWKVRGLVMDFEQQKRLVETVAPHVDKHLLKILRKGYKISDKELMKMPYFLGYIYGYTLKILKHFDRHAPVNQLAFEGAVDGVLSELFGELTSEITKEIKQLLENNNSKYLEGLKAAAVIAALSCDEDLSESPIVIKLLAQGLLKGNSNKEFDPQLRKILFHDMLESKTDSNTLKRLAKLLSTDN